MVTTLCDLAEIARVIICTRLRHLGQSRRRTLVVADIVGTAERVNHVRRSAASTAFGRAQPALNNSRAARIAIVASIGLLASMHSTSNWNSGMGLSSTRMSRFVGVRGACDHQQASNHRLCRIHRGTAYPPRGFANVVITWAETARIVGAAGHPAGQLPLVFTPSASTRIHHGLRDRPSPSG